MKVNLWALLFSVLVILSTGCSSIVSKSSYVVEINSDPEGADFVISNRAGEEVLSGVTPNASTLKASSGFFKPEQYTINFSKKGYQPSSDTVSGSLDPWYFGNILIGGLLGMLIIDPATGAMYELQDAMNVSLEPTSMLSFEDNANKFPIVVSETAKESGALLPVLSTEKPKEVSAIPVVKVKELNAASVLIDESKNSETVTNNKKSRRISFEGVYYDIEPGTVIGYSRVGSGTRKKSQLEWTGQKNPYQYNELVELQLEAQGYPLIKYENRLLNFDKVVKDDLKIGMVVEKINVDYKKSARYQNKFHKVEMQARFKISQINEDGKIYTKRFNASAIDVPTSREDSINAYPKVIKKLVRQLLADQGFLRLAKVASD